MSERTESPVTSNGVVAHPKSDDPEPTAQTEPVPEGEHAGGRPDVRTRAWTGTDTETARDERATEAPLPGESDDEGRRGRGERRRRMPQRGTIVATVVVLVVVGLAVSLGAALSTLGGRDAVSAARASALAAGRTDAVDLGTYDYRHLRHDFGAVTSRSTPSFQRSFTQSSDALLSVLSKYHATAKATVVAAGLVSAGTNRATVLVFLNQTVSNTTQKTGPTTDQSRVELTLVRSSGQWLIEKVHLL